MGEKITKEKIQQASNGTIISKGIFVDEGETNMEGTGQKIKWVATAGVIDDFAIYYEYIYSNESEAHPNLGEGSDERISTLGNKLPLSIAQNLPEMTEESISMYRN